MKNGIQPKIIIGEWKSGELFTFFPDWKTERIDEVIFEDFSGGVSHFHCMDTIICRKMV